MVTAPRTKSPGTLGALVLSVALYFLVVLAPGGLVRVLWVEAYETDGPSMEPTLMDGDRFAIDRTAVGLFFPTAHESVTHWASPERGDVVVVHSPMDEVDIVKRVIGVAGDRVEIIEDEVLVNGESLGREAVTGCPSADADPDTVCFEEHHGARRWRVLGSDGDAESMSLRTVPEDTVFVLGDHRNRSNDSRNPLLGMVPLSRVIGVARFRYWSEEDQPMGWIE